MTDTVRMSTDSDCGGDCLSGLTTRSVSGRLITLNQVPVDWASKRQAVTADSPAAAEIMATREAVAAGRLFLWRCRDAGLALNDACVVELYTDSKQCITFAEGTCINSKLGGVFDRKEAWVQELRDAGKVRMLKVASADNPADLFTKPFTGGKFQLLVKRIQGGGPGCEVA